MSPLGSIVGHCGVEGVRRSREEHVNACPVNPRWGQRQRFPRRHGHCHYCETEMCAMHVRQWGWRGIRFPRHANYEVNFY